MTRPKRIEIPSFPQGKRIAVTTSWDDGPVEDRRVVAAFNEWGLKGTFNLNSGNFQRAGASHIKAGEVAELYRGHEVAVHTVNHPWLTRLDGAQIATEVLDDRRALEDLVGYPVRGMAYPFGDCNERVIAVLRSLDMVYARTVAKEHPCFPPREPLAWPATMHMFDPQPAPLPQRWQEFHDNPRSRGVFFVWGHTYEFRDRNNWEQLEGLFRPLAGKPDVWYCTNIELFDYEAARQRMVIAANRASAYNPSGRPVTLSIDGTPTDIPPGQIIQFS